MCPCSGRITPRTSNCSALKRSADSRWTGKTFAQAARRSHLPWIMGICELRFRDCSFNIHDMLTMPKQTNVSCVIPWKSSTGATRFSTGGSGSATPSHALINARLDEACMNSCQSFSIGGNGSKRGRLVAGKGKS